jgi:hypothetical protein
MATISMVRVAHINHDPASTYVVEQSAPNNPFVSVPSIVGFSHGYDVKPTGQRIPAKLPMALYKASQPP